MASNIENFDISQTFSNLILTTVTGETDTSGVPNSYLVYRRTDNTDSRAQGKLQDALGHEIPLVLSRNLIEVEASPSSAYSVMRRADIMGLHASQFINAIIWS